MTYAEYGQLPDDDGLRYELIDGELHVSAAPNTRHQDVLLNLAVEIAGHLRMHGGGRIFIAPYEVDFFDRDAVQPDLIFVADAHSEIITPEKIFGVPSLVVEVLSSSSSRDRRIKKALYERHRVGEYWIVDPELDRVEIYRLDQSRYGEPSLLEAGEMLTTALMPGLAIDLSVIFER
ncbi:MAG: Uma2 family endonuclease [Actinomycetota bacterium]